MQVGTERVYVSFKMLNHHRVCVIMYVLFAQGILSSFNFNAWTVLLVVKLLVGCQHYHRINFIYIPYDWCGRIFVSPPKLLVD